MATNTNDTAQRGYIYVASSWRNERQPEVVAALRAAGLGCYDFRNPEPGDDGFRWTDVDPEWTGVNGTDGLTTAKAYLSAMEHPVAQSGFDKDFAAMKRADTCVLILPCGRSAHLELGWSVGARKRTAILLDDPCTPELMNKMVDFMTPSLDELVGWLAAGPSWASGDRVRSRGTGEVGVVRGVFANGDIEVWWSPVDDEPQRHRGASPSLERVAS